MDKVILAKDIILDGDLGFTRPNDNQIVIGSSGSGKTWGTVFPTFLHMTKSSLIGIFAKGELISNAVPYFNDLGYKTYVWNIANLKKGDKLPDPLSYVSSDDDVQELAHQISNSNPEYRRAITFDPYWKGVRSA